MSESSGSSTRENDAFESLLNAYWDSLEQGELPDSNSWAAAHSDLDEELRDCFDLLQSLHDSCAALKEDSKVESAQPDATLDYAHPPAELLTPGMMIGRCRIERLLGRGGMGEVYLAVHETLECKRAVKVLPKSLAGKNESARRFLKEVKALGKIGPHPNVVAATHADIHDDGRLYLEMEYWPGMDLSRYVHQTGPLSIAEARDYLRQVTLGLAHLHQHGIVHRDIKPSNLLRTPDGTIKILDFGLAKLTTHGARELGATVAGDLLGTFDYISPEQVDDSRMADQRSDLYSMGCTFYFLLTARPPFADMETRGAKLMAHLGESPKPIDHLRDDIPSGIITVADRLLAKAPAERFQQAKEVLQELENTTVPGKKRPAIGIDLGTTYTVIARIDPATNRPTTIRNEEGDLTTPSVVLIDQDETIVGKEAVKAAHSEPSQVSFCAKRLVGLSDIAIIANGKRIPPQVIQAYILKRVVDDARRQFNDICEAVISVPAHFDEVQRRATYDAAYIAGIDVLDIVNEPTTAALAYGIQQGFLSPDGRASSKQTVLVYDLGGGTFDATVVSIDGADFTTLATDGDMQLGGRDWDEVLVEYVAERYVHAHGIDPRDEPRFAARLWQECEDAKRTLSKRRKALITCDFGGRGDRLNITRDEFEMRTRHLLERTEFTTRDVVRAAGLDWSAIDRIVLVGGSTRMPMVREMLERVSGRKPEFSSLPEDEAVAQGAALYADMLLADGESRPKSYHVHNVNSHSLGVVATNATTNDRQVVVLIPRNSRLPTKKKRIFRTAMAGQKTLVIPVVEGENPSPENCTSIGDVIVRDLPPHLPDRAPVEVTFGYKDNGRLVLAVRLDKHTQSFELERKCGLSRDALEHWRRRVATPNG